VALIDALPDVGHVALRFGRNTAQECAGRIDRFGAEVRRASRSRCMTFSAHMEKSCSPKN
jgi:hypothetical protein